MWGLTGHNGNPSTFLVAVFLYSKHLFCLNLNIWLHSSVESGTQPISGKQRFQSCQSLNLASFFSMRIIFLFEFHLQVHKNSFSSKLPKFLKSWHVIESIKKPSISTPRSELAPKAHFNLCIVSGVRGNFCCKYSLLEISRLLSHADLHTIELSRTFHQGM